VAKVKKTKKLVSVHQFSWGLVFWPAFILALYLGLAFYLRSIHALHAYSKSFQALVDFHPPRPPEYAPNLPPTLQSDSWLLLDPSSGETVVALNPQKRIYPASLTKLATALTALNLYPWTEPVEVLEDYREGKVISLTIGQKLTVGSLVQAVIIHSANDAAVALADHHPQGQSGFIDTLNKFIAANGLTSTHFVNVDGVHSPDHYSTAADLARLARLAIAQEIVLVAAQQTTSSITDLTGQVVYPLVTTNELLGKVPEIEGLKTGWTPEAGGCFIGLFSFGGHRLISVITNSPDRFGDTQQLLNWSKANLYWE
jgi:D-alanyl-D-alanine carboxypeptidase (penicillin-binding protein 5/6)